MNLNYDLNLQLSDYLYQHYQLAFIKLINLDKNIYPFVLYTLRKQRYILTESEYLIMTNIIMGKDLGRGLVEYNINIISKYHIMINPKYNYLRIITYIQKPNISDDEIYRILVQQSNNYLFLTKYLNSFGYIEKFNKEIRDEINVFDFYDLIDLINLVDY